MPIMSRSTSIPTNLADAPVVGLPRVNYLPSIVATLVASVVLFLFAALLALAGLLNTITQLGRAVNNETGASYLGAGWCGLLTILALLGVFYFTMATIKGVRDLSQKPYFTRGVVSKRRSPAGRKANNWLIINPSYVGPDLYIASITTDEQKAASIDRSEIFQPRFTGDAESTLAKRRAAEAAAQASPTSTGTYLSPERISAPKDPVPFGPDETQDDSLPGPKAVFRIDFASRAGLAPDEEVLVAHSHYLQHVYYVARLRNGEWEAYTNRKLI
jgi:hypothetical protein